MTMPKRRFFLIALAWLHLLAACALLPGWLLPSSPTPTAFAQVEIPPSPTPTALTQTILTPVAENDQLNPQGPWLLLSTDRDEVWAANPNGSGLTKLAENAAGETPLQDALQPGGSLLALVTADGGGFGHMVLNLVSLPDGKTTRVSALTSDKTEKAAAGSPGEPGFEALRAVKEQRSLAWSPDGKTLAFSGVIDGPSADIYLYNLSSAKISRLTKEKDQDFNPSWAPDGRHILFLSAAGFGTGAGAAMSGVWLAAADGSRAAQLFNPKNGGETVYGWVDWNTVLISGWTAACGSSGLSLYNTASQETRLVNQNCFSAAALSPEGDILFGTQEGLFHYPKDGRMPTRLDQGNVTRITWEPASRMFAVQFADGRLVTLDGQGEKSEVSPFDGMNAAASNSALWAWTNDGETHPGVWINRAGQAARQIYADRARFPLWDGHKYLLFLGSGGLFRAQYPDYADPVRAAAVHFNVEQVIWAGQ